MPRMDFESAASAIPPLRLAKILHDTRRLPKACSQAALNLLPRFCLFSCGVFRHQYSAYFSLFCTSDRSALATLPQLCQSLPPKVCLVVHNVSPVVESTTWRYQLDVFIGALIPVPDGVC